MDFLPFPLASMLAGAFITLLCFVLLLNIFGLPANWVLLGLVALWKVVHPGATSMDMWFWIMMVGIAVVGEALEMGMQILKAKRYGSSSSGTFAGMIGAIAGAILLAPLFFGIGALVSACGCVAGLLCGRESERPPCSRSSRRRLWCHDGPFFGYGVQVRCWRGHAGPGRKAYLAQTAARAAPCLFSRCPHAGFYEPAAGPVLRL